MKRIIIAIVTLLISTKLFALNDIYKFDHIEDQQRFNQLTTQFRCLVCQNQNLAESNASLAEDLRNKIYFKIQQGETNEAIIQYLINRYGNYILYKPPLKLSTSGLWLGPFAVVFICISYLLLYIKKKRREY